MNRRLRSLDVGGENKIVLFDPRIVLDDQVLNLVKYKIN